MTDHEWDIIAKKAFPVKSVQAPPYLWTRVLAGIESEERSQESSWWRQWRWMLRLTFAAGLFATVGSYYLFEPSAQPTADSALEEVSAQHNAITLARHPEMLSDETTDLAVEVDS